MTCNADLLCVEVHKDERVHIVLDNRSSKPLSFRLFLSGVPDVDDPPALQLDSPGTRELLRFRDPGARWGFEYRIHYGHVRRAHDDAHVYTLPFAPGAEYPVSQSHINLTTHHSANRYALDFPMPVGEPVHAARGGKVVSVYGDSDAHSLDGEATSNHVWIEHSDGTIGKYLHLAHRGVQVIEGDSVQAGERIGTSGNTGFTRGPHLHFSVSTLHPETLYETFDVLFATDRGPLRLVTGERYRRPAEQLASTAGKPIAEISHRAEHDLPHAPVGD